MIIKFRHCFLVSTCEISVCNNENQQMCIGLYSHLINIQLNLLQLNDYFALRAVCSHIQYETNRCFIMLKIDENLLNKKKCSAFFNPTNWFIRQIGAERNPRYESHSDCMLSRMENDLNSFYIYCSFRFCSLYRFWTYQTNWMKKKCTKKHHTSTLKLYGCLSRVKSTFFYVIQRSFFGSINQITFVIWLSVCICQHFLLKFEYTIIIEHSNELFLVD